MERIKKDFLKIYKRPLYEFKFFEGMQVLGFLSHIIEYGSSDDRREANEIRNSLASEIEKFNKEMLEFYEVDKYEDR